MGNGVGIPAPEKNPPPLLAAPPKVDKLPVTATGKLVGLTGRNGLVTAIVSSYVVAG